MNHIALRTAALVVGATLLMAVGCQPKTPNTVPDQTQNGQVKVIQAAAEVAVGDSPHGVAFANGKVYVCNNGSDTVSVIDPNTGAKESDITVEDGPAFPAVTHDGTKLLVSNDASGSVGIIDLAHGNAVTTVHDVGSSPFTIQLTDDDRTAYVSLAGEPSVAKVNLAANPVTFTKITTGAAADDRPIRLLGDSVVALDNGDNTLTFIDPTSGATTPLTVGNKPGGCDVATFTQNGTTKRILVVANNGSNTVSLVDLATKAVLKTLDVGIAPVDVAAVGPYAYVTNSGSNTVSVVDALAQKVVSTLGVGTKPVHAVVALAGGKGPASQVWIGNDGSGTVSVIDTSANTVYATLQAQGGHHTMAFSPDGSKGFVTNLASNSLTIIDRNAF